jgi:Flp pilus assembly protein TadG
MKFPHIVRKLLSDRFGNFGVAAALLIPVVLAAISAGVDYSRLLNDRNQLQQGLDSAAVAAAASLASGHSDPVTIKTYATNFLLAELSASLSSAQQTELSSGLAITVTSTAASSLKTYNVKIKGSFSEKLTGFALFLGKTSLPVAAASEAQSQSQSINAVSLYLVLDRSGSMSFVTDTVKSATTTCQNYTEDNWAYYPNLPKSKPCYTNKIAALKTAAATLFDELDAIESVDKTNSLVRVGSVSFTDVMQTETALTWGTTASRSYVNALPAYPTGGTDMTDGMAMAYKSLTASAETTAQSAKGNKTFSKFIVLMTDGENTGASSTWKPSLDTETQATCDAARTAGVTIYTVGFMAPANGEKLLKSCAGKDANYYSANDMDSLVSAFAAIGQKVSEQTTRIMN